MSNQRPNLQLKELGKEETKPKAGRREEIIKTGAEINEIEKRKPIEKINESKRCFFEKINESACLELDGLRN